MKVHSGHRQRMRDRFLKEGLDSFNEHQVLELLLFYCIPRIDTNELAHRLLAEFGSFSRVLEAPVKELEKVPGIGHQAASFLSLTAAVSRYYQVNRTVNNHDILPTIEKCGEYLVPFFIDRRNEVVFLLCMDAKCKVLCCKQVGEGSVNSAGVPVRKIVEVALNANASSVVLAHNHPSGLAFPSGDDVNATKIVAAALRAVDVILTDHVVVADNDYISMVQSRLYDPKVCYVEI